MQNVREYVGKFLSQDPQKSHVRDCVEHRDKSQHAFLLMFVFSHQHLCYLVLCTDICPNHFYHLPPYKSHTPQKLTSRDPDLTIQDDSERLKLPRKIMIWVWSGCHLSSTFGKRGLEGLTRKLACSTLPMVNDTIQRFHPASHQSIVIFRFYQWTKYFMG